MGTTKTLHRHVSRLPAGVVARLDVLAAAASRATGKEVSRAAIVRAVLDAGLTIAESSVDFTATAGGAVVKRGRKAGMPTKQPSVLPPNGDSHEEADRLVASRVSEDSSAPLRPDQR